MSNCNNLFKKLKNIFSRSSNVKNLKGICDYIFISISLFFMTRLIRHIFDFQYLQIFTSAVGMIFPIIIKVI
jgi:hypothetical protein